MTVFKLQLFRSRAAERNAVLQESDCELPRLITDRPPCYSQSCDDHLKGCFSMTTHMAFAMPEVPCCKPAEVWRTATTRDSGLDGVGCLGIVLHQQQSPKPIMETHLCVCSVYPEQNKDIQNGSQPRETRGDSAEAAHTQHGMACL